MKIVLQIGTLREHIDLIIRIETIVHQANTRLQRSIKIQQQFFFLWHDISMIYDYLNFIITNT